MNFLNSVVFGLSADITAAMQPRYVTETSTYGITAPSYTTHRHQLQQWILAPLSGLASLGTTVITYGRKFRSLFVSSKDPSKTCAVLGYYAAYGGNSLTTLRDNLSVPSGVSWPLKMGPMLSPNVD